MQMKTVLLAAMLLSPGCTREDPPLSVANQSEAMIENLEARANALEMQAERLADGEAAAAMANASASLDAASANSQTDETVGDR